MKITIRSLSELEQVQQKLRVIRVQHAGFAKFLSAKIAKEDVLPIIHQKMRSNNFSQKIIDGTTVSHVQIFPRAFRIFFKSEYFAETGFDVALARETGTRDHDLPKVEGRTYAWTTAGGQVAFSKGHRVKGLPALLIISSTLDEEEENMNEKYNREFRRWVESNLSGVALA